MYQQLPEFIRREPKAYWFLSTMQAGAGIALALLFSFSGLLILAPAGAIFGVLLFTKRDGIYIYEKIVEKARWLALKVLQSESLELNQAEIFRTTTPTTQGVVVVRKRHGPTIAIRPGPAGGK
jgi:hypothetical protein